MLKINDMNAMNMIIVSNKLVFIIAMREGDQKLKISLMWPYGSVA